MPPEKTESEQAAIFKVQWEELGETAPEIALRISRLGDFRHNEAILRSIQRMISGETRVSGEMQALLTMMVLQQRRLKRHYRCLVWEVLPNGSCSTQSGKFRVTLSPRTHGRWSVDVIHIATGYSHPWPRWQPNLEKAKMKAMLTLEEAEEYLSTELLRNLETLGT